MSVYDEISAEVNRSIQKHGMQLNVPMGTGPEAMPLVDIGHGPLGWSVRYNHASVLADRARRSTDHDFAHGGGTWRHILLEEVFEAIAESDPAKLRMELVQVGAIVVKMINLLDLSNEPLAAEIGPTAETTPVVHLPQPEDAFGVTHGASVEQAMGLMAGQFQFLKEAAPTIKRLQGVIEKKAIEEKKTMLGQVIADKYDLTPIFMEDKVDGSDVVAVEWSAVFPVLVELTSQLQTAETTIADRPYTPVTLASCTTGSADA